MLLVWSVGSQENISIKAGGFSNDNYNIDKESTSISVVRYVLSDEFSRGCGPRNKDTIPVHISPDLLSNASSFSLEGPGTRPIRISVDIPSEAPAGIYKGTISRQSASGTVNHIITLENGISIWTCGKIPLLLQDIMELNYGRRNILNYYDLS
jgi:hypothetical protein